MSFRIDPTKPLAEEVRRIAADQIGKAVAELETPAIDRHEAIHDVRKRAKKLRALLRLVRSGDESLYKAENARLRDLARRLSGTRDRTALIEAADGLAAAVGGEGAPLRPLREALAKRRDAALAAEGDQDALVAETVAELQRAAEAIDKLSFAGSDAKIVARGVALNHARARRALKRARGSGDPARFHELRKRAKYQMHHLRLLRDLWPEALKPVHDAAEAVAEDLGRDHDYAVLTAEMEADPDAFGSHDERDTALGLVAEHSADLRAKSLPVCARLYAEPPRLARERVRALWRAAASPSV
ncbi:CHAD domain-containing protein [Aureimonas leprariae]|uniref:CHAD domain-containing protein n=1 Tax=Plantimonas leprariae TaxID=2615207 RepID=A0A7V7PRA1_9HYPH|nr:CHAD domain-containing protein [Aureimonas leprariae]KAB0681258.1 CHAD domain-containing protein [Aureimonas leprariae]